MKEDLLAEVQDRTEMKMIPRAVSVSMINRSSWFVFEIFRCSWSPKARSLSWHLVLFGSEISSSELFGDPTSQKFNVTPQLYVFLNRLFSTPKFTVFSCSKNIVISELTKFFLGIKEFGKDSVLVYSNPSRLYSSQFVVLWGWIKQVKLSWMCGTRCGMPKNIFVSFLVED